MVRELEDVALLQGAGFLPEQVNDEQLFGLRVAWDLFTENYRPRGDLRRWTVIERVERAHGLTFLGRKVA